MALWDGQKLTPNWVRETGFGLGYWLLFLSALEPGNITRALGDGAALTWGHEASRILGASMLGALATPAVMSLVRRYPVTGEAFWVRVAMHAAAAIGGAFVLIVISCLLAPMFGVGDTRPFLTALPDHLAANWVLLSFSLSAFAGFAHAVRYFAEAQEFGRKVVDLQTAQLAPEKGDGFLTNVPIRVRGHVVLVELDQVDWIETQGNYLALRTGGASHLLRETMAAFEPKLDPRQFKRIHRRTLVAINRVREVSPLANGDAVVRLTDGSELRLSRSYRAALVAALA